LSKFDQATSGGVSCDGCSKVMQDKWGHPSQLYGFSGPFSIQKTGLALSFFLYSSNRNPDKAFACHPFKKTCLAVQRGAGHDRKFVTLYNLCLPIHCWVVGKRSFFSNSICYLMGNMLL
jgi:hypothetical protein